MAKDNIGGRAFTNGICLMNNKYKVKAHYENNNIKFSLHSVKKRKFLKIFNKIPIIRGIFKIFLVLIMFIKESFNNPKKYWIIFTIIGLDLIYMYFSRNNRTVSHFILLLYLSLPVILILFFRKKIREILKYHGAEHKVVNYYENNFKGSLKSHSRLHRKCGSNIVFYYLIITILAKVIKINLPINPYIIEFVYIGIAFEVIKYTPDKLLFIPYLFQRLVTKEPEQKHLKIAVVALNQLLNKKPANEKIDY